MTRSTPVSCIQSFLFPHWLPVLLPHPHCFLLLCYPWFPPVSEQSSDTGTFLWREFPCERSIEWRLWGMCCIQSLTPSCLTSISDISSVIITLTITRLRARNTNIHRSVQNNILLLPILARQVKCSVIYLSELELWADVHAAFHTLWRYLCNVIYIQPWINSLLFIIH